VDEINMVMLGQQANYEAACSQLGDTVSLIQEVVSLYGVLADAVKESKIPPDQWTAK